MPRPKSEPKKNVNKSRRTTLFVLATGFVGGLFADLDKVQKGVQAGGALLTEIEKGVRHLRDKGGDLTHRLDLVRRLFRVSGNLHIPAPKEHPLYHRPGPHDLAAMAVPASLYVNPSSTASPVEAPLSVVDTLFAVGSPINSALAAMFVPNRDVRIAHKRRPALNEHAIPYHFLGGSSKCLLVKSATGQGAERVVVNHGLLNQGAPWHPIELANMGNWLRTDFLLLTVLPWNRGGGRAVFACGGHGPGTHALDLLLSPSAFPLSEFETLVSDLSGSDAFQVVFEVSVNHDGIYSMPSSIRVSPALPPKKLKSGEALFLRSDEQMLEEIREVIQTSDK